MPSNYKTRKYTQWLEKRSYPMGASCKFAHGNEDFRLPERPFRTISNPKCKTKMCKAFEPGASGLYAYAERFEYIDPTVREHIEYNGRIGSRARSRLHQIQGHARRGAFSGAVRPLLLASTRRTASCASMDSPEACTIFDPFFTVSPLFIVQLLSINRSFP
ncbi:hypothetical protein PFISCL1PPCAC_7613 [Pristionchus fissidentatus]|uniref:C3H1-type domain-containing protein n=1 Tax=Pristionchus fissidentatus TaxID=1538716 RepID=A0AAV5VAE2_9BILA|nr:hypothetical protein PFISCL1PPCAC_7613 [Pristionchus fissidentatus]